MLLIFKGYRCDVIFSHYMDNNNTSIELQGQSGTDYAYEPIATATVNTGVSLAPTVVAIKGWSENEGMEQALIEHGVIKPRVEGLITCGHVLRINRQSP